MEALFIEYARQYGIEKAMQMLGLDQKTKNPKYAISLGNQTFNPLNMLARSGINQVFGGKLSGIMGPAALLGGAVLLGNAFNPLNPNARNYSPNLRGQIDYLSGKNNFIGTHPTTGLTVYGPGSVLAGKGVTSFFGTNNYQTALENKIGYFEDRIKKGKPINEKRYEQAKKEKKDFFEYRADVRDRAKTRSSRPYSGPTGKDIHGNGSGSGGTGSTGSTSSSSSSSVGSGHSGSGYQGASGSHHYRRGGIASLF
jgi:hypothetical protein